MSRHDYAMAVELGDVDFDEALKKVQDALADEGFGVLTEIDVAATLKNKLDLDHPPYRILGACNPQLASKALAADPQIGLLLPCNVVVRLDQEKVKVEIMSPEAMFAIADLPEARPVADEAQERLSRVADQLRQGR